MNTFFIEIMLAGIFIVLAGCFLLLTSINQSTKAIACYTLNQNSTSSTALSDCISDE